MGSRITVEEPPERSACPAVPGQAAAVRLGTPLHATDPTAREVVEGWLEAIRVLERRPSSAATRLKLADSRRICEELGAVLAGVEPGEGTATERQVHVAVARGRIQALSTMFSCPGGTFIELLATAPWNLLAPGDPPDPRTVRGAGSALLSAACDLSRRRGGGGRVALQAENPRSRVFYERLGFRRMTAADRPLTLVPPGACGWSASIVRLARRQPGPEEERSPWLVRDGTAASAAWAVTAAVGRG